MSLFGTKEKQEIAVLQNEIAALKAQLTPEHITLAELNQEIEASRVTLETVYKSVVEKKALLKELESQIIETDERLCCNLLGCIRLVTLLCVLMSTKLACLKSAQIKKI